MPVLLLLLFATRLFSAGLFEGNADVGVTPKAGSVQYDAASKEYSVTGGGANIWGVADAFQFVYKKLEGDFTITADVRFVGSGAVAHRKAALMLRQSLEPDAVYADVAVHGDGLTSLQYRKEKHGVTAEVKAAVTSPARIRLQRRGNTLTMYAAKAGEELAASEPVTVEFSGAAYLGLAVCSHDADVLETAVFSNVNINQRDR